MSSKVLLRDDNQQQIQAMVWRNAENGGERVSGPSRQPSRFEPPISLDPEAATLRNRVIEMEQASRQAVETTRRQAFAEGERQGRDQAALAMEPVLAQLTQAMEELSKLRPRLREEAESDVVQLSLAIARRVLHRELSVDAGALQALVRVALDRLASQEIYRVRIHPAQEHCITAALAVHHSTVEIQTDPRLAPGALVFETNRGKMDASVSAQLEEIERGLADRVPN